MEYRIQTKIVKKEGVPMKKIKSIAALLIISVLALACGCLCLGCWGYEVTPDNKNDENNSVTDDVPQQEKLSKAIDETFWTDGAQRFEFKEDGGVIVYAVDKDYDISESKAEFTWKYREELLYFCNSENEELVRIDSDNEKIISKVYNLEITRSDAVFVNATVVSERNHSENKKIFYENYSFVFFDTYRFFDSESATKETFSPTLPLYAFPNDITAIDISFNSDGYDKIHIHNYISDDYVNANNINLPNVSDEGFLGWFFQEIKFDSVIDVIEYASTKSVYEIKLESKYEIVDEHTEFVTGEYVYTNRKGETFTIIIDKNYLSIYDDAQILLGCFEWKYSDEYGYEILKDVQANTEIIGAFFEPNDDCSIITIVDCKEIKSIFGVLLKNIPIERIDN